ncbi:SycD/LcrH family type III secretion system chaperone [Simkania sp.]|uniref:SycD/LcrH family type III secretion system chaperone n=1 Tax=Simkania sp. TaxID=34094 RepID=UPI003B528F0B
MFTTEEKKLLQTALGEIGERIQNDQPLNKDFSNKDLSVLYTLAYNLYQSGDYDQAKEIFHQLVLSKPLKQKYWLGLGACLQLEKQYEEALKAWGMASILDGYDPLPHFHAAECNFALNDFEQGCEALKASKKLLTPEHHQLSAKVAQLETYYKNEAEEGA